MPDPPIIPRTAFVMVYLPTVPNATRKVTAPPFVPIAKGEGSVTCVLMGRSERRRPQSDISIETVFDHDKALQEFLNATIE